MATLLSLLMLATPDPGLITALKRAAVRPEARIEVIRPPAASAGCHAESWTPLRPIEGTGSIPVRIEGHDHAGHPCLRLEQVGVRVYAAVAVTAQDVAAGATIASTLEERELLPGRGCLPQLEESPRARRPLRAGECLTSASLQFGPEPGSEVQVELLRGPLTVASTGRAVDCGPHGGCADLPGGRRVNGRWRDGVLEVVLP